MSSPPKESLRERRRRQTQHEVHLVALRLAREHGFDKVTVDMISTEAGISHRTFFNYFPTKDAAVVAPPGVLDEQAMAEFAAAGPATPARLLAELGDLLIQQMAVHPPRRQEIHDIFELTVRHPAVLAAMLAQFEAFQSQIADLLAQRLGQRSGDEVPTLLAAVALAAMRQGMQRWAHGSTDPTGSSDSTGSSHSTDNDDSPIPHLERSMRLLRTVLLPDPGDAHD